MTHKDYRKLLGKIEISGTLECLTGLHIGASKENMEIGAIDAPVVKDPLTSEPYIPGSSLKGKLRALLEKAYPELSPKRDGGSGIKRHECDDWDQSKDSPGALNCPVCRLFGSTGPGENNRNFSSRIKVRDLRLDNVEELEKIDTGLLYTEWKFENSIDRVTSAANPRNLERIPRGAKFSFSLIYDVEDIDSLTEDMDNLKLAIQLLHDDSLGGHGSRGYGQVTMDFERIQGRTVNYYKGSTENTTMDVQDIADITKLVKFFQNAQSSNSQNHMGAA
ncbi:MAG: type III-A CRISPR-associated RAMP protein Csm3 [bacterium]